MEPDPVKSAEEVSKIRFFAAKDRGQLESERERERERRPANPWIYFSLF